MKSKYFIVLFISMLPLIASAQLGGSSTYAFLGLPSSARVAALGGSQISLPENDLSLVYSNPALLNDNMHNNLTLNYMSYYADIKLGYVAYARNYNKLGMVAAGIQFVNYGTFTEADEFGQILGEFSASEYAFQVSWAKELADSILYIGATAKPIYSKLEKYSSFGLAADIGLTYMSRNRLFSAALVFKNIGTQMKPYIEGNYEPLPFEIQLAITKRLKHAPFRFSIVATHLQTADLTFENQNSPTEEVDPFTGEIKTDTDFEKFSDRFLRHFILGVEFLPFKNFHLDFSYNHRRRKEMELTTISGMTGFSWGFGLKISKFHISYANATYHLEGASHLFSISTNFSSFARNSSI